MTLIIISFLVFLAYLVGTVKTFGLPASISDTYYLLERRRKGLGWLFTAFCWIVAGTLLPAWLDGTPTAYQFTAFLSSAGLLFVGAAPQFKLSLTGWVHYGAAALCGTSAVLWCILRGYWFIPFNCFLIFGWLALRYGKPMFWLELAAFGATYLTIFIHVKL